MSEAISLQLLYNKGMAKRIKGFTHIGSQDICEFLNFRQLISNLLLN